MNLKIARNLLLKTLTHSPVLSPSAYVDECFCSFIKADYNFDFFQVMDAFQKSLLNNNFELIATDLFNDDPKLQIEHLKVRFDTTF